MYSRIPTLSEATLISPAVIQEKAKEREANERTEE